MGCATHHAMSGRAYESSLSMSRPVYRLKTNAVLWQCGWSGTKHGKNMFQKKKTFQTLLSSLTPKIFLKKKKKNLRKKNFAHNLLLLRPFLSNLPSPSSSPPPLQWKKNNPPLQKNTFLHQKSSSKPIFSYKKIKKSKKHTFFEQKLEKKLFKKLFHRKFCFAKKNVKTFLLWAHHTPVQCSWCRSVVELPTAGPTRVMVHPGRMMETSERQLVLPWCSVVVVVSGVVGLSLFSDSHPRPSTRVVRFGRLEKAPSSHCTSSISARALVQS